MASVAPTLSSEAIQMYMRVGATLAIALPSLAIALVNSTQILRRLQR
jgi:hypothetical protein